MIARLREALRLCLLPASRALGAVVCRIKGEHRYHYADGSWNSWCAYQCIRCGELDRPLESLPDAPDWGDYDYDDHGYQDREAEDAAYARDARWFARLPWPRWI